MRYVAAYLLSALGGNQNPSVADIKKILGSVGIDCDDSSAKRVVDSLHGKSIEEVIREGSEKLASVPSGGGAAAAAAPAAAAGGAAAPAAEAKKEEKKEESESEEEDMGFGLFD